MELRSYSCREYELGDEKQIVELLDLVFGGWPDRDLVCTKVDFWRWKYLDNPIGLKTVVVAVDGDRIIGCSHRSYFRVKIGDAVVLCGQGMDSATHPDYRSKGVFSKLEELKDSAPANNERLLNYAVHVNPILIERLKRRGECVIFPHEISDMVRISDINLHLSQSSGLHLQQKIGFYVLSGFEKFKQISKGSQGLRDADFIVEDVSFFEESINDLWDEVKAHYNFILERKQDYMNWRYCDSRAGGYVVKIAKKDDQILGYVVLKINRFKAYHTGHIVDLLTLPSRDDVLESLLLESLKFFDENNINAVRQWVNVGHPIENAIRRHGFINSRSGIPLIVFNHINVGDNWEAFIKSKISRVHFQMGDTEWM